ncbi:Brefeldin A-inhibited guanine nucleotide-exchange protein 3 [Echinococcus granulosus]|uniref:Brefeldin A-inhibited guanine nucleotide-exchange protein 3 n=1 Tax=Echinococcus granulosus TaxID=6210 RepID=W6UWL1_ECHGR|nr:Brefeldin A-inhibited guanine nucleotide-exchange protein 3 [Echinococcus granulosus]EUB62872.1 Brefeldin A-inhibited guanine nucleotide-exchange protein 3 [Echinococcus granulosus]
MSPLKSALELIRRDGMSEKWQFLLLLTDEALSALNDESIFHRLPKCRLREIILAPIQVSLESSNSRLNCDALSALEAFVDSDFLYDGLEGPVRDTDLTSQFLDTISPCTIFSDATQASFLKICTDLNSKYVLARNKEKASIAYATLVQTVKAFVAKNSLPVDGLTAEPNPVTTPKSAYTFLCGENSYASDLSEPQLQILGVLKCLIEAAMPDNTPAQNRITIPMYIQAIATIISLLPVSLIRHRVFLNILWQRMCPMLMWFLSNPKQERNITSTSVLQPLAESGVDRKTHGTASSIAPPTLWPEVLKLIYDIVIDLAYLVGPVLELRPMLESLFHKMLLYPPPTYRQNALNAVCGKAVEAAVESGSQAYLDIIGWLLLQVPFYAKISRAKLDLTRVQLLSTTEGLLCITGPLVSVPMLSNSNGDSEPLFRCSEPQMADFRIFDIILESVHSCSLTKDQALVCTSAKCVNAISGSLSTLIECEGLCEAFVQMIGFQLKQIEEVSTEDKGGQEVLRGTDIPNANLPRTLEVDRWAAHDYLLSLMKTIPNLLDAQSIIEVDNLLLEFSSAYCKERRLSELDSVLCPMYVADLADDVHIHDVSGALLNADAIYATTISALTLNYRLLQAGFYSTRNKAGVEIMSETEFLDSILGTGLMLYVSETWLSQVYRGIRHQDLLSTSGLDLKLLCASATKSETEDFRGASLVKMLVEFDGVGWTYDKAIGSVDSGGREAEGGSENEALKVGRSRRRVGEVLVSRILLVGWQRIVETLTNTVAFVGTCVDKVPSGLSSFSFFAHHPSTTSCAESAETSSSSFAESASKSLLQNLFGLFYFGDVEAASQSQQLRELGSTLSESLRSLQQLAILASGSTLEALRTRCGAVFALLTETARAAAAAARVNRHCLPPNRLHSAHALGIHVVLSNALRLGCHSPDCWFHLLNVCQLVRELEHAYFASVCDSKPCITKVTNVGEDCDLPGIVQSFSAANPDAGECLTLEQTGVVLSALSAQVDQIFDTAAEALSLPALIDFLSYLLQASSAELAARSHPQSTSMEHKPANNLKQAVNSVKDELVKVARLGMASLNGSPMLIDHCNSHKLRSPALFLDRMSQLLLRAIRSPRRPLFHLLRAWVLVSQHLVDACCFSSVYDSTSFESDAERLLVSQRALACLHECIITAVTTRLELPYFSANEMFCKPFEILLRLEMCDGELQDRIISCISEIVEGCNSALHSGWRPIFAALRSIKVPFLTGVDQHRGKTHPPDPSSYAIADATRDAMPTCPKVSFDVDVIPTQRIPNKRRISTVLEIFEIFLFTDDILVFCNTAVDCVRCLLRYLSARELDYFYSDNRVPSVPPNLTGDKCAEAGEGSIDEQTQTVSRVDCANEASCSLCVATLPLLSRCCEVFGYIWGSFANASASGISTPPVDYVLRSAKCQARIVAGGPPELSLLTSVRSFTSPTLHERVKNLTPWFSTGRFLEPAFHSVDSFDLDLSTLRSLDDIDQPSGVLHLWFLTLEGIVMAVWDCNPRVHRVVFEEFTNLLDECVEKICGKVDVTISRLTDGIEREAVEADGVAIGPSFAVFVINHVLLPRLQTAIVNNALTGDVNGDSKIEDTYYHNGEHLSAGTSEDPNPADETDKGGAIISKLSFIIGQTTQLVCNLIIRFQQRDQQSSNSVVGINLMLHQCLHALVDCISVRNERLSRLATSCLRHLLMSTATCLTVHQWEITIAHLEEAFRACLLPIHILTTVYDDRARRLLPSDAGLQLANLRPIGASNKLRQLALRLFQSADLLGKDDEEAEEKNPEDGVESFEKPSYSFEFRVFPLCTHEVDRPPLDTIPLSEVISSQLNTNLLIRLIGELLLSFGENGEKTVPKAVQELLFFDPSLSVGTFNHNIEASETSVTGLTVPASAFGFFMCLHSIQTEFFTRLPLSSGLRLLNCLSDSYAAFFDFDQCDELKQLVQRLLKLQSPANFYQHSHLTATLLQMILLQTVQNGLTAKYCGQLSESVKMAFCEFDENLTRLRAGNFRRLPLQLQTNTGRREFVSPLPWLKPFVPDAGSDHNVEQFALLLTGLSTHLTQFYLFLLYNADKEHAANSSPIKRCEPLFSGRAHSDAFTNEHKRKLSESNPKRNWRLQKFLSRPRRFTIDASTTTTPHDTNGRILRKRPAEDRDAQMTALAESLATLPQGFLALPLGPEAPSTLALEGIFTCNTARLIAVAEHGFLRRILATWFLRLVQNQKVPNEP